MKYIFILSLFFLSLVPVKGYAIEPIPSELYHIKPKSLALYAHLQKGEFSAVHDAFEALKEKGYTSWDGAGYFGNYFQYWTQPAEEIIEHANEWILAQPLSTHPYTIRGASAYMLGTQIRGSKFAHEVPQESMERMNTYFKIAKKDFLKAIELDPQNAYVQGMLIRMLRYNEPDKGYIRQVFDMAKKNIPDYYPIYGNYMSTLAPKWGGSEKEIWGFVHEQEQNGVDPFVIDRLHMDAHHYVADYRARRDMDPALKKYYRTFYNTHFAQIKIWADVSERIKRIEAFEPKYARSFLQYAKWARDTGRGEESVGYFLKAIEAAPIYVGEKNVFPLANFLQSGEQFERTAIFIQTYLTYFKEDASPERIRKAEEYMDWYHGDYMDWYNEIQKQEE